jgi:hypothetical protein
MFSVSESYIDECITMLYGEPNSIKDEQQKNCILRDKRISR